MARLLRVGTRRSALALAQTELVLAMLRAAAPDAAFEAVPLSTEGDERRDVSLRELGGTGAFVKRIERALLRHEIDLAVHSLKDVPTQLEPGLLIAAFPERGDPRDALVLPAGSFGHLGSDTSAPQGGAVRSRFGHPGHPGHLPGHDTTLDALPRHARVGTGSARRAAQLLLLRPDLRLEDVRGNVDTRLRKLDEGEYDALVLAAAGLIRLGRADRVSRPLEPAELTPMVGQGALGVEARADDGAAVALAARIDHRPTRRCVEAERAFLARLGGGCRLPVGALATVEGGELRLRVVLGDETGRRVERREGRGRPGDGAALAARLADEVLAAVAAGAAS
jgi:hydroxymethylbilane synthase